ncbi:unnamed protein product [Adineta steineri]|uniref:EGF-like domain-containing protein n=1 Tax=Adineta steineri TaxID=433720 RepID=A0A814CLC0_9BILA|nr:unnamed protein product [Adineta steineri]
MLYFRSILFLGTFLLILISLTRAANLDISCTEVGQCNGIGTACRGEKCQCDTPWYTPCGTECSLRHQFVYEGEECRDTANCLNNTVCTEQRCRCMAGFTSTNGLCYKNLNTACSLSSECWSGECRDTVCRCPLGFAPKEDNTRCQKTLAELYPNHAAAGANNKSDFCYPGSGTPGCRDPVAICKNDSVNPGNFCQCPPEYIADYEKQECRLNVYSGGLSPSTEPLPNNQCGTCSDENALCVLVGNQTTCWCQAGFEKNNENKCEKRRPDFIFPNSADISSHFGSSACSSNGDNDTIILSNSLCTCKPFYEFVDKTSSCRPITPKWQNDAFEYGVCTRINSRGVPLGVDGLCPPPLTCQARQDKFVCACSGRSQYLDESNNTCYHFVEKTLTNPDGSRCPPSSILNNTQCQCSPNDLYKPSIDSRRCELTLVNGEPDNSCVANSPHDTFCVNAYGENAKFCKRGECRCASGNSYYNNGTCVTLLHVNIGSARFCPNNAELKGSQCECKIGYRAANGNRTCEPKVNQLLGPTNTPAQIPPTDVTNDDCRALFPDTYVRAHNDQCVCVDNTFLDNFTCVFYLEHTIQQIGNINISCPNNAGSASGKCNCSSGYINGEFNRTCIPKTNTVFAYNVSTTGPSIRLTPTDCRVLFGNAADVAPNNANCECLPPHLAFWNNNRCYFLLETAQTAPTNNDTCPPNSITDPKTGRSCNCPAGYQPDAQKQTCVTKAVYSQNLESIDTNAGATVCNGSQDADADCVGLHGTGAVCRNNRCYCDRRLSYVRGNQCELFAKYVFPGAHERSSMTCNSQEDCGADSDSKGIECDTIGGYETDYKVCKCKSGYLLNPTDGTCVNERCQPQCQANAECHEYQCICKPGFYTLPSGQCVEPGETLQLHKKCNTTIWNVTKPTTEELICSPYCQRAQCTSGYRDDGSQCVKNKFDDRCAHNPAFCSQFSSNAFCYKDENKCTCNAGFYQSDGEIICARAVNGPCNNDYDCGEFGECLGRQCKCRPDRKEEQVHDYLGRPITRCINGNISF